MLDKPKVFIYRKGPQVMNDIYAAEKRLDIKDNVTNLGLDSIVLPKVNDKGIISYLSYNGV
nr:hypothetical protein [Wolbachia endosymbiont (group A) of Merzomyia westermanni]